MSTVWSYARIRGLGLFVLLTLLAAASVNVWATKGVATPVDPEVSIKVAAFVAVLLALVLGETMHRGLGVLELERPNALRRLKFMHVGIVALVLLVLGVAARPSTGLEWAIHIPVTIVGLAGLEHLVDRYVRSMPHWLIVVSLTSVMFVVGIDRSRHAPRPWSWLLIPSTLSICLNVVLATVGLALWLLRPHAAGLDQTA